MNLVNYLIMMIRKCRSATKKNIFKKLRKVLDNNNYYFENELNQSIKYFMDTIVTNNSNIDL